MTGTLGQNIKDFIVLSRTSHHPAHRDVLVKLIINPNNGKVVGLHALSPLATEYALEGAIAIKYGLTFEDIVETTHIFPTLAEGVKLTAQAFLRNIDSMSCCVE